MEELIGKDAKIGKNCKFGKGVVIGDNVEITPCRPISHTKRWRVCTKNTTLNK